MTTGRLSRRFFVRGSGAAIALATAGGGAVAQRGDLVQAFAACLREIVPNQGSAAALGRAVQAQSSGIYSRAEAMSRLLAGLGQDAFLALPVDDLRARLVRQTREDFRTGRVVVIDGWRLSETETAVATLLQAGGVEPS